MIKVRLGLDHQSIENDRYGTDNLNFSGKLRTLAIRSRKIPIKQSPVIKSKLFQHRNDCFIKKSKYIYILIIS